MATAAKKKTKKAETKKAVVNSEAGREAEEGLSQEDAPEVTLEQLVLDRKTGKYEVVEAISYWAKHLRQQEELRHLTQNDILELAMREVLSGKVSEKEIYKKIAAAPPVVIGNPDDEDAPAKK